LYALETALVTALAAGFALAWLARRIARGRPSFSPGRAIGVAFALRVLAALGVSQLSIAAALRGGDETVFVDRAREVSHTAFASGDWVSTLTHPRHGGGLHDIIFATQFRFLDSSDFALRIMQAAIATVGIALLAAAVYELAGPHAGTLAAWLLAFEPTNVFFSTLLHKEAVLILAEGLACLGAAIAWKRAQLSSLILMAGGCLGALATRPYVAWFLIAGCSGILLHSALRNRHMSGVRTGLMAAVVVMIALLGAPFLWDRSSSESLQTLQGSQDANASDQSNLKLERVNYSTRGAIIRNLPVRIRDVMMRPYPWQVGNTSQRLGLLGTIVAFGVLWLLARALWTSTGSILARAGPFAYVGASLLFGYALSVGNAGTGFRYRTHLVTVGICLLLVLLERQRAAATVARYEARPEPVPALVA
jgi:dolichyl-phosphate-mannose-protein mannosyltransferase